jgi:hypothetical protein
MKLEINKGSIVHIIVYTTGFSHIVEVRPKLVQQTMPNPPDKDDTSKHKNEFGPRPGSSRQHVVHIAGL